jgi:transcriptional regulator GlxA family with amidase domain
MDRRPAEEMRVLTGFHDSGPRQSMSLLSVEAARGGFFSSLYADSLAHAIAARPLCFNENTASLLGQTPHRFLVQLRLERAKNLLQQCRGSLIEVAASCGFSSHAHMTQVFRRELG